MTSSPFPRRILVVEDDRDIAELLVHVLQDVGFQVQHAENGLVALGILREAQVDLLLTDLTMPVMSGQDLIRAVSDDPRLEGMPILVISALADDADILGYRAASGSYIQKPFRVRHLLATVDRLLQARTRLPSRSTK